MATKVHLSRDIVKTLIQGGISLRSRQTNQATNALIKTALNDEIAALTTAMNTLEEIKDK